MADHTPTMNDNPNTLPPILEDLANDAFVVGNWARRLGLNRDRQIEEIAKAMQKTLRDRGLDIVLGGGNG